MHFLHEFCLFGLFSRMFVNSSQASQFGKRNFKYKQNGEGEEITNFLGFPVFHAKPQQRKWQKSNDLHAQWQILRLRLNPSLSYLPSVVDQRNTRNSADTSDLLDKQQVFSGNPKTMCFVMWLFSESSILRTKQFILLVLKSALKTYF